MPNRTTQASAWALVSLVLTMGALGLVVIGLLFGTWRRYNARLRSKRPSSARTDMPDIWKAGGERLSQQMDDDKPPQRQSTDPNPGG